MAIFPEVVCLACSPFVPQASVVGKKKKVVNKETFFLMVII